MFEAVLQKLDCNYFLKCFLLSHVWGLKMSEGLSKAPSKTLRIVTDEFRRHLPLPDRVFWVTEQRFICFWHATSHIRLHVLMVNFQMPKTPRRLWTVCRFHTLSALETNIRRESSLQRSRDTTDTRLGHPEWARINDNLAWQHADHKRWGHPKKCLGEENKISRARERGREM